MGYKNREIELKLLAANPGKVNNRRFFNDLNSDLSAYLVGAGKVALEIHGSSYDVYWNPPKGSKKADFIRLRQKEGSSGGGTITVKHSDHGKILNRVEIDCEVEGYDQALLLLTQIHGEPSGFVEKEYFVYFLKGFKGEEKPNVSIYQIITEGKRQKVYVEVEGRTEKYVQDIASNIAKHLDVKLTQVKQSLFEMYVSDYKGTKKKTA